MMSDASNAKVLEAVLGMTKLLGAMGAEQAKQGVHINNLLEKNDTVHEATKATDGRVTDLEKSRNTFYGAVIAVGAMATAGLLKAFGVSG